MMGLSEFKAWFEGFSEGVGDAPTPEQWAKIKAKVATISASLPYTGIRDVLDTPRIRRDVTRQDVPERSLLARYAETPQPSAIDATAQLRAEGRRDSIADEQSAVA